MQHTRRVSLYTSYQNKKTRGALVVSEGFSMSPAVRTEVEVPGGKKSFKLLARRCGTPNSRFSVLHFFPSKGNDYVCRDCFAKRMPGMIWHIQVCKSQAVVHVWEQSSMQGGSPPACLSGVPLEETDSLRVVEALSVGAHKRDRHVSSGLRAVVAWPAKQHTGTLQCSGIPCEGHL